MPNFPSPLGRYSGAVPVMLDLVGKSCVFVCVRVLILGVLQARCGRACLGTHLCSSIVPLLFRLPFPCALTCMTSVLIATGPATSRQRSWSDNPFSRPEFKRVTLYSKSWVKPIVREELDQHGLSEPPPLTIVAAAELSPDFVYDPCRSIDARQVAQVQFFDQVADLSVSELLFFDVERVACFDEPVPLHDLQWRRGSNLMSQLSACDFPSPMAQVVLQQALVRDGWAWQAKISTIIFVAPAFAPLLAGGFWKSLVLAWVPDHAGELVDSSSMMNHYWNMRRKATHLQKSGIIEKFNATRRPWAKTMLDEPFSESNIPDLLSDLRRICEVGLPRDLQERLSTWVGRLSHTELFGAGLRGSGRFDVRARMVSLIRYMLIVRHIRSGASLAKVVKMSLDLVSTPYRNIFDELMAEKSTRIPSKSTISRSRFILDCSLMLVHRCDLMSGPCKRYITWDSSPQHGRDYEWAILTSIKSDVLSSFQVAATRLETFWGLPSCCTEPGYEYPDDMWETLLTEDRIKEEAKIMNFLRSCLHKFTLPATCVGFASSSLPHKLSALAHALRLCTWTHADLQVLLSELVGTMQDQGTEYGINRVGATSAQQLAPQFVDPTKEQIMWAEQLLAPPTPELHPDPIGFPEDLPLPSASQDGNSEGMPASLPEVHAMDSPRPALNPEAFEDEGLAPEPEDAEAVAPMHCEAAFEEDVQQPDVHNISFDHLLNPIPVNHIFDNATEGLRTALVYYSDYVSGAVAICRLLRRRQYKTTIMEKLFTGTPMLVELGKNIFKFKGWVHPKRWGTLVFSIPELLDIERALVHAWSPEKLGIKAHANDGTDLEEAESINNVVLKANKYVTSPHFWAWLSVVKGLGDLLTWAITWTSSCTCHWHLLHGDALKGYREAGGEIPPAWKRQWESCPLRSMRGAEMSDFMKLWAQKSTTTAAAVLFSIPGVPESQKTCLLQEFECGRVWLTFYLTTKFNHLQHFPHLLFKLAHPEHSVVQDTLEKAIGCKDCKHPILLGIKNGPIRELAMKVIDGDVAKLKERNALNDLRGSLRAMSFSEFAGEGEHARTHHTGLGRHQHSEAYISFEQRYRTIEEQCSGRSAVARFAKAAGLVDNTVKALDVLGLSQHSSLDGDFKALSRGRQDSRRRSIVYHADAYTMYSSKAPELLIRPLFDEGGERGDRPVGGGSGLGGGQVSVGLQYSVCVV